MKMIKTYRTTWFRKNDSTIQITGRVNSFNVRDFCGALTLFEETGNDQLTLDFTNVTHAYPNGMLAIIAQIQRIRQNSKKIYVRLPMDDNTRKLFRSVNWAHHLSPDQFPKSESSHDRHLVTRFFTNATEQKNSVDDFMDVILRNMELPRDIISGLEWSINEITDNVLNHSQSEIGGIVEATTYPSNEQIAFAVADAGVGILTTLKEGIPTLRTDLQAMGEAVKQGVTRNPKFGQGNGLAGSLRFTTMTGGSFEITSGNGRLLTTPDKTTRSQRNPFQVYNGTLVCGQVRMNPDFSISKALDFGTGIDYTPVDIIESLYEMEDADCFILKMKAESTGYGSRKSGIQIRTKINNLISAEPTYPILIDWEGVPVISSSFADELMGKLFLKLGPITFAAKIRNVKMDNLIKSLLDKAISQRLTQANDEIDEI